MGAFDSFNHKKGFFVPPAKGSDFEENPLEPYEIQEPVERMVAARIALDQKAHNFLERFQEDPVFEGILDVDEEWRCWIEADTRKSCLFFDDSLEVFENTAYDHFVDHYSAEWKEIARDNAEIEKMGQSLDEYRILKTSLYNVFNNKNRLPMQQYFAQVYSRAPDYNIKLEKDLKKGFDLTVSFSPLREVNRGNPYLDYQIRMIFNPDYKKDGYIYSAQSMDAQSAKAMYSGPVELPVYGAYAKFEKVVDDHFLGEQHSLFYYDALKSHRQSEKAEHGVPADYFEGTYVDTKKLVDFSDKAYQYGNSKIFIPKSQVALVGNVLYMKRWLYYKLKNEVEEFNKKHPDLSDSIEAAKKDQAVRNSTRHFEGPVDKDRGPEME